MDAIVTPSALICSAVLWERAAVNCCSAHGALNDTETIFEATARVVSLGTSSVFFLTKVVSKGRLSVVALAPKRPRHRRRAGFVPLSKPAPPPRFSSASPRCSSPTDRFAQATAVGLREARGASSAFPGPESGESDGAQPFGEEASFLEKGVVPDML